MHMNRRDFVKQATVAEAPTRRWGHAFDALALHPVCGVALLLAVLFTMFQAVFAWSQAPIEWIESGFAGLEGLVTAALPAGFLRSYR